MNEAVDTVDTYMSGTTAGIVIVYSSHGGVGSTVIAANVGDSRVVLAKVGGEGVPLSMYVLYRFCNVEQHQISLLVA